MFTTLGLNAIHQSLFNLPIFFDPRDALLLQPFLTSLLGTGSTTI